LRYIDISRLNIPKDWKTKARRLTRELCDLPEAERRGLINDNSDVWGDLKPYLEEISHGKCWYCEVKMPRADFHVDHHRPKNRIKNEDGTNEPGYWWLAFEYKNFRLACSYCNCLHTEPDGIARGKSDRFPLHPSCARASSPDSNLQDEMPYLLDPTNLADPFLLWFQDDGKTCPKHEEALGFVYHRAVVSIDILNLNGIKIVEARKELWRRCITLMKRGDVAFAQYRKGSPTGRTEYEAVVREMQDFVKSSAEFCATARACFWGSPYDWVRDTVR